MGEYTVHLVGESRYQEDVSLLREGQKIDLIPEPTNRYDKRAIKAVDAEGCTVGYIERDHWVTRAMLDEGTDVFAVVQTLMGGTKGKKMIGVVLTVWTAKDAEAQRTAYREKRQQMANGGCLGVALLLLTIGSVSAGLIT